MKKFTILLVVAAILLTFPVTVQAAGASLGGPDVVRAGDTVTLSFYAGGGIFGCRGVLSYDSSVMELLSIKPSIGGAWKVDISGNIIMAYDDSQENPITGYSTICTATFKISDSAAPGTTVSASISAELTTTELTAAGGGGSWSRTIAEPLSDNANLASLVVSNASITPGFSPSTTSYSASVPFETSVLQVSATAEHAGAKVSVSSTNLVENATTDVQVTVTAENGSKKVYHIYVDRPRDPNYVESSVNTLSELGVKDFQISPAFKPERQAYAVYLPYEVNSIQVTAKTTDNKATVKAPTIKDIPVGETTYEIPVKAENGKVRNYTITVFRAEAFLPEVEIEETEPTVEPTTEPTVEPTTEPTTEPTLEPTTMATEATEPAPVKQKSSGLSTKNLIIFLVCYVLSFLAGMLVPKLFHKKKKKK